MGAYAWLTTVNFGVALVDIASARLGAGPATTSEVADLLLLGLALLLISGVAAIAASQGSPAQRLLIISVTLILSELFVPVALASLPEGSPFGAAARVGITGAASLLALAGFGRLR